MILNTLINGLLLTTPAAPPALPATGDAFVVRVGRAETVSEGTIEHAVILVEDGKITLVGEDLPVERGLRVYDFPDWVVTPGLVNAYSRLGLDGANGTVFEPSALASAELYAGQELWKDVLETGTTTLGLYPPGNGISGQAVAVRPRGDTAEEMIVADRVYLMMELQSDARSKKALRDAFEELDEYDEKVEKAREKWEKDQEKKKKKKKDDKDKDKDEDEDEGSDEFVPPDPDEKVKPFLDLRSGDLTALIEIRKAADLLHLQQVIEDRELTWSLRCPLPYMRDNDFFEVADRIGEAGLRVVMEPSLVLQQGTRRERNVPAELDRAGARIVLVPRTGSLNSLESWVEDVGELVALGLDRDAALAAITHNAAEVLGLGERLGSLAPERDANMVFWNGDPFQPGTEVQAVMLEGAFVHGEVQQ